MTCSPWYPSELVYRIVAVVREVNIEDSSLRDASIRVWLSLHFPVCGSAFVNLTTQPTPAIHLLLKLRAHTMQGCCILASCS
jgi:hypothetical protein